MLLLNRGQIVGLGLEDVECVSKNASHQFAAPQQETTWQTYLAGCVVDMYLLSNLNSTQNCIMNYSNQGEVSVRVYGLFSALSIGARNPRSMNSTLPAHVVWRREANVKTILWMAIIRWLITPFRQLILCNWIYTWYRWRQLYMLLKF